MMDVQKKKTLRAILVGVFASLVVIGSIVFISVRQGQTPITNPTEENKTYKYYPPGRVITKDIDHYNPTPTEESYQNIPFEYDQALKKASDYLEAMAFSAQGLKNQLEFEGFSTEASTYAVNHCGADWNEQAVKKAREYLSAMSFSSSELREQLKYEGFTWDQREYAIDTVYK